MNISAIIVTYNRPDALEVILRSILAQRELPGEVVIADDGSGAATAGVINSYRSRFPVPLKQVWHEDRGFRGAAIRNRAIRESTGDYLVFSDGDLLFHPSFFRDFRRMAAPGSASIASRVFLTRPFTEKLLRNHTPIATALNLVHHESFSPENGFSSKPFSEPEPHSQSEAWHIPAKGISLPGLFSSGIEMNRINGWRMPFLAPLMPALSFSERLRGGLLGVWRKDLEAVNGWNEEFSGWGLEDTELVARLHFSGVSLRKLKFAAVCYHLWHPVADRQHLQSNRELLRKTIQKGLCRCNNGLFPPETPFPGETSGRP